MMTPLHHRVGSPLAHKDTVIGDGDDILEVIPDNCRGQKRSNTNLHSSTCRGHCERID